MGWQFGEPLVIDKDTLNRDRFDRGRMLVLVPKSKSCSCKVRVHSGKKPFMLEVEEEVTSVEIRWIDNFLELVKTQVQGGRRPMTEEEGFQICGPEVVGEKPPLSSAQQRRDTAFNGKKCETKKHVTRVLQKVVGHRKFDFGQKVFVVKGVFEKDKQKWVSKKVKKRPLSIVVQNEKLNLEKKKGWDRESVRVSEDSSSSSEVEANRKFFLNSCTMRGESSRKFGLCTRSEEDGLTKEFEISSSDNLDEELVRTMISEEVIVHVTMEVEKETGRQTMDSEEEMVQATIAVETIIDGGQKVEVNSRDQQVASRRVKSSSNSVNKHRMITRYSKVQGVDGDHRSEPIQSSRGVGEVESEVVKILEIGSAIDFNFRGIQEEVEEEIARREVEDGARFEAMNG
ncbi:hypothetical protein Ddye_014323 [Dipteronia dyeriana]|uniref:Uncharacterized protein n=1 Tax=Dipteronia dyeriana TaxID=168575 RepID=A0AAD9X828_9ROSI|nr:hypothetical protein Ddye_014323 [Dipteronia dyeriana]